MTIIDLSHRICDVMPVYPGDVQTRLVQEHFLSRDYYNGYTLHTALHAGTHVDAPMHLLDKDQRPIAQLPLERFCGPGFLLDGLDDPREIPPDCCVLIHTGHDARYGQPDYFTSSRRLAPRCASAYWPRVRAAWAWIWPRPICRPLQCISACWPRACPWWKT